MKVSQSYPKGILEPLSQNQGFGFTESLSFILHKLSGIDLTKIENCKILRRGIPIYLPWYNSQKGGGAITLGNKKWSRIIFTENFFSDDDKVYGKKAYGDNYNVWLRMASHEVVHIEHTQRFRFLTYYLLVFIYQYIRFGHDNAPLEKEAELCTSRFYDFNRFLRNKFNTDLGQLLSSDKSQEDKISMLEYMWSSYMEPIA